MKLHLPTRLRAAVLACITAVAAITTTVGTGVITTGAVAYTLAVSQAEARESTTATTVAGETTYNGYVYTMLLDKNTGNFHERNFALATYEGGAWVDGATYAGNGTAETPLGAGVFWTQYCATASVANSINYYGNTLRLGATSAQVKVTPAFTDFCLGGLVVEKGTMDSAADSTAKSAYWFYRGGAMQLNGVSAVNMDIADHVRFSYANEVAVKKGGVWNIASTGSISFDNNSSGTATTLKLEANQQVTIQGGGKVNIGRTGNGTYNMSLAAGSSLTVNGSVLSVAGGATTLEQGSSLVIGAGSTATHASTLTAAGTISNGGALTLGATTLTGSIANTSAESSLTLTGALTFDVTDFTTASSALLDVSKGAFNYSGGSLALTGDTLLAEGVYTLVKAADETAAAAIASALTSSLHTISNDGNVVKLTVAASGMETLTEDLTGAPNNNFHKVYLNGLDVGEHTITATYAAAGYSTLYTKDLKGSGDITFNRTNGGNNLCVLWVDGDASEYTGTIAMSNLSNVYLKLGSNNGETDLSNATVNMTKEILALGNKATIGTLTTNETEIRAVNGTVDNIANMSTGMQASTAGFVKDDNVFRVLTIATSGELTKTTINSGVTLAIAEGASVTLAGGTLNGLVSNSGALNLSGALTLNGPIMMGANASATFAGDVLLDLSKLTADEGVYHILDGAGTSNLASLNESNVTGIDLTGKALTFDNSGTITLVDNTSDLVWKGGAGVWDETSQNWKKGGDPAVFADADRVSFNAASDVTLVGDLIAGGVNVNDAVILKGSGSLDAKEITIAETGSLTINGEAAVSVERAALNKMQVSGDGTLVLNKIGNSSLDFDGGDAGFSGTLVLNQESSVTNHNFTAKLVNFTGTLEINALINHAASDFGDASKLVFVGSRATDQIGFWCGTGINPTLTQEIEITGDNEVRFFLNGTTLNGNISGNKLRLQSGTGTFGGQVELNRLNLAQDGVVLNLKGDTTLGALVHDGNNTRLNVGDAEHQVTLNITGTEHREHNVKSHTYSVAAGSVVNDNGYIELTNSTLTVTGGGIYNLKGICSAAAGDHVGNVVVDTDTTLHITGTNVSANGKEGSFMLSNWASAGTYTVRGTLISDAAISGRDGVGVINIENGGTLRLNAGIAGVTEWVGVWGRANINVKEGGLLQAASNTMQNDGLTVSLSNGATLEGVDVTGATTIAQNLTISGTTEAAATANVRVAEKETLTISSIISGENGALNKIGNGTLVLSGANTYAGGTTVQGGTLDAVGSLSTGDISIGSGATLILHDAVDATKITNNGTLEIASGFTGLEGTAVTKIDAGAEGNGFSQGGETNIFKTEGTLSGTLSAVFNGATVAVGADGSVTLGADWGTYHINNALLETETFNAIKTVAEAHSAKLVAVDFAAEDQTLKVDAEGFATSMVTGEQAATATLAVADNLTVTVDSATLPALQLAEGGSVTLALQTSASATPGNISGGSVINVTGESSLNTLSFSNGNINHELNITDATVTAGNSNGTGFNTQATNINAGGVLRIAGSDSLGWGNNAAGLITLTGSAEKLATMELGARQTLSTSIAMNGNSVITAISADDHSTPMLDPYGGSLTVTGTNNTITTGVRQRSNWNIDVQDEATLLFDGTVLSLENAGGGIFKLGNGTMTFRNASGSLRKFTADGGVTVLDNTVFTVAGNMDLSHGGQARGIVKLQNNSALDFANAVNLWVNNTTSLEVDETSAVNFTRDAWSMSITGAKEGTPAVIAGTKDAFYNLNDAVVISNAVVTAASASNQTVSTKITDSSLVNNGSGTLTFSNAESTAFTAVNAHGGDITLNAATSIGSVTIAAGKTLTASADDALNISTALTAGAGATLSTALSLANSASLDLFTGENALSLGNHAITLGTGLSVSESMMGAITSLEAEQSLTLIKDVTSLTGGSKDATEVISGLTGDYTISVQEGNLVISAAAAPTAVLTWLGDGGTWNASAEEWTTEGASDPVAYTEGAVVIIGGESALGGTIEVSGDQSAKSVTFASDGYTLKRAETGSNSLTITDSLTVNEGVTANLGFMPTVSSIVLQKDAVLDMSTAIPYIAADTAPTGAKFVEMLAATTGEGKVQMTGDVKVQLGGGEKKDATDHTFATNFSVTGTLKLQNWSNDTTWHVGEGKTLSVTGDLWMSNKQTLSAEAGSTVTAGTLHLGMHEKGGEYKGILIASDATLNLGHIIIEGSNADTAVTVTGGSLTITDAEAFEIAGVEKDAATVSLSGVTLSNGKTDMVFNHSATLTDVTISATPEDKGNSQEATTITLGGEGMTTTLVGTIINTGNTVLAGTVAADEQEGAAAVTNTGASLTISGTATLASITGGAVAGTGSLTLSDTSSVDSLTLGALTLGEDATMAVTGAMSLTTLTMGALDTESALVSAGSLTSSALNVVVETSVLDGLGLSSGETAIVAALGAAYEGGLTLNGESTPSVGESGYRYTISLDESNNIIVTATVDGDGWVGEGGKKWGDDGSAWETGSTPGSGDVASFVGSGSSTVEVVEGGVSVGSVVVESSDKDYTFTGGAVTTGALSVNEGTLTIDNTITADSTVVGADGSIIINEDKTLTAGEITVNEGASVTNNGTLVTTGGSIAELAGGGNLTNSGEKALNITGDTAVATLDNTGTIIITDGGLTLTESTTAGGDITADSIDMGDKDGSFGTVNVSGDVSGNALTIGGADSSVEGTVTATSLTVNADTEIGTLAGTSTALTVGDGATLSSGEAMSVGSLSGSGKVSLGDSLTVGSVTTDGTDVSASALSIANGANTLGTLNTNSITLAGLPAVDNDTAVLSVDSLAAYVSLFAESDSKPITLDVASVDVTALSAGDYTLVSSGSAIDSLLGLDADLRNTLADAFKVSTSYGADKKMFILTLAELSNADKVWKTSETQTAAGADVVTSGSDVYDGLDKVLMADADKNATIDLTDATAPDADGLVINNLTQSTPNKNVTLTIIGDGDDVVTLANSVVDDLTTSQTTSGKEKLDITGTTVNVGLTDTDATDLTVGDVKLTDSALAVKDAASLTVGKLDGDADSALSGAVTVTEKGGVFNGSYSDATVSVTNKAEQKLVAGDGLTVAGDSGKLTIDCTDNSALAGINTTGAAIVILGDVTDSPLTLGNTSTMEGGSLTLSVSSDALGAGAVLVDGDLTVDDKTTITIKQLDSATTLNLSGNAVETLGQLGNVTSDAITLSGAAIGKYFYKVYATDGVIYGERNTGFFSDIVPTDDANAAAGLAMLDEALVAINPQGTAKDGALADIMNSLEGHSVADAEKLAAGVAGAGLASVSMALSGDVDRQLRAIRNRTTTMGVDQCVVNEDMPYINAWMNAEGDFRKMDSDGNKAGYDLSSWGGTVGFDIDCTPRFTCGMAFTAMYGDFKSKDVDSVSGDLNTYYVSAFARYANRRFTHTAVATFGLSDLSLDRTVAGADTKGDTDGTSFGAMYELGYVMALNEDASTCLQPIVNVSFRHVNVSGYTESGSDNALKVGSMTSDTVTVGAGARLQSIVGENIYNRSSIFEARALVKVDAGDTAGEAKTSFASFAGSSRTVKSADMGKVGVELGAGLTIPVGQESGSIFVDGSAELRSGYTDFNATIGYRVNF